jgi:hypothetical protein
VGPHVTCLQTLLVKKHLKSRGAMLSGAGAAGQKLFPDVLPAANPTATAAGGTAARRYTASGTTSNPSFNPVVISGAGAGIVAGAGAPAGGKESV